ncbi:MAG TPA: CCA tRNA nucleotidyltransferase, partial [Terriglobales bacterium]|nr:CCA tRNA nucleotidyltransferase [Terriglobales bacterium]
MSKAFGISIVRTLREQGHQAYLVGGCVRDLLLGREPADYDVATDATPEQVMGIFPETYAVGAQFGVVLVPLPQSERGTIPQELPSGAEALSENFSSTAALEALRHPKATEVPSGNASSIAVLEARRHPKATEATSEIARSNEALRHPKASIEDQTAGVTGQTPNLCHSERSSPIRSRIGDTVEEPAFPVREETTAKEQSQPGETEVGHSHKLCVEVATFRRDVGYSDGRHPDEVQFSRDPREDVQRRDFTINGLLLDPEKNEVLDFVGGQADLKAGIIRAIGNPELRFAEDKLRMLRAVRFAARFEYRIDPATFEAIKKLASQIAQVSRERVRDELTRMLTEGRAKRAFELLDESGLLREVLPEISAMEGVEQPPEFHPEGDVFVHTLLMLKKLPQPCPATLAWGVLLHDVGKPPTFRRAPDRIRFDEHARFGTKMAEAICRRLRFSNDETRQIVGLVENHMRFGDAERMNPSTFKKFIRLPHFEQHLELHRLDCESSHRNL